MERPIAKLWNVVSDTLISAIVFASVETEESLFQNSRPSPMTVFVDDD